MKITPADKVKNMLKSYRFETPDFIPMTFAINDACWQNYPQEALWDLMEAHPFLFPDFRRPRGHYVPDFEPCARKDAPYTDPFGCVWTTSEDGITGTVTGHPLADWDAFETWKAPDPALSDGRRPLDWEKQKTVIENALKTTGHAGGTLPHGHTFLRLCDIRGYQNLLFDMMDEEPLLDELIEIVEDFNMQVVKKFLSLGVDMMGYPEDLGMQFGPMLSPENFRRYILPSYRRLMKPSKDAGVAIRMHSDGDIRLLVDDLIEGGVECINLQDLVNGIDWIAGHLGGKVCVDLDIDRQSITPFGTPEQVDALVREEVSKISTPQGGLTMIYGLYPGVPLENIKALMDAMEKYAFFHN